MTRQEIDRLWSLAIEQAIKDGEKCTRYHFTALVIEKVQAGSSCPPCNQNCGQGRACPARRPG